MEALFNNTTGNYNTAIGYHALYSNVSDLGSYNDAFGEFALQANTTGNSNLGIGGAALISNTTGGINTAIGLSALYNSTTAFYNIALGYCAGQNQTTGNNNIYLSGPGVVGESDAIRIGNVVPFTDVHGGMHAAHTATFIAGINGTAVVGSNVVIDANGQLGTATSSARFKKNIKPMENASDAILTLKPVTFEYNSDAKGTPQFGLIAEDVAKVNSDLVVRDRNGEIYSVRYDAVNAMLLNEFLKEHRTVQALTSTVAKQEAIIAKQQKDFQATVAQQQKQIDGLAAGLQKVSAQLEASRPVPQVVNNP